MSEQHAKLELVVKFDSYGDFPAYEDLLVAYQGLLDFIAESETLSTGFHKITLTLGDEGGGGDD